MDTGTETVHASCVALGGRAVLLCGASGSGKSDLALRLIARGWTLVADDATVCRQGEDGDVLAAPPTTIAGRLEARGAGILRLPHLRDVPVRLLVATDAAVERLPERAARAVAGRSIPWVAVAPFELSAPLKVEAALAGVGRT